MSKLESSAELQKIGQLLGVKSQELEFLQDLPLSELVKLRALSTDKLFNDGHWRKGLWPDVMCAYRQ